MSKNEIPPPSDIDGVYKALSDLRKRDALSGTVLDHIDHLVSGGVGREYALLWGLAVIAQDRYRMAGDVLNRVAAMPVHPALLVDRPQIIRAGGRPPFLAPGMYLHVPPGLTLELEGVSEVYVGGLDADHAWCFFSPPTYRGEMGCAAAEKERVPRACLLEFARLSRDYEIIGA